MKQNEAIIQMEVLICSYMFPISLMSYYPWNFKWIFFFFLIS